MAEIMDNIHIEATSTTPAVDFNFTSNQFSLRGMVYPENSVAFFSPFLDPFRAHLAATRDPIEFTFELTYFNSSSARFVMGLFETLDEKAADGYSVKIIWICDEDDDNMQEIGEEFSEDYENFDFEMKLISA